METKAYERNGVGVVNIDNQALSAYRRKRNIALNKEQRLYNLEKEISSLNRGMEKILKRLESM